MRATSFRFILGITVWALLLFVPAGFLSAQEQVALESLPQGEKRVSLVAIQDSISQLSKELEGVRKSYQKAKSNEEKTEFSAQSSVLTNRINELKSNFTEIASGIDLKRLDEGQAEADISWNEELKELVGPVLAELKDITRRPREISRLQSKISVYENELVLVTEAQKNVEQLIATEEQRELKKDLEAVRERWIEEKQRISTQLAVYNQRKDQRLSERKTLSESLGQLFQVFFRTRGKNLLLAVLASLVFWLAVTRLHKVVRGIRALKKRDNALAVRAMNIAFVGFSAVGAILVFLLSLYFFSDWVLLIIAVMLLVGAVWGSKTAIPVFWKQIGLLLNMGPVREGERVMFEGLPWKVKSLKFYTTLENPSLSGGEFRLPITDLLGLRSRCCEREEQWFPTKSGDWVLLEGDLLARVVHQSPELVKLIELGGALRTFRAASFYEMGMLVLSKGFRISTTFGLDYVHQKIVTEEIPTKLQEEIMRALAEREYDLSEIRIQVEFKEAGASSLNLSILADFPGSLGKDYNRLSRLLQRVCVEACNSHDWVIPFDQLTLHLADGDHASEVLTNGTSGGTRTETR